MITNEAKMQSKSMVEEIYDVKCKFLWKIRIQTNHQGCTGINAPDIEANELRKEGEISW